MFIILGLTQVLGVGTVALIAHAVGRKDQADANLIFNQSLVLSALCAAVAFAGGYALAGPYMRSVGADAPSIAAGTTYLYWFIPCMALQFALVAMGSALRGTGIVQPTMVVQIVTVVLNIVLAPVLIAGWGTGRAFGVAGAGLASSAAVVVAVAMLLLYFLRLEKYVGFHRDLWRPRLQAWKRMLAIGLPAGGEFMLMFLFMGVIYWCIREFGADAQAGFGVGSRVMQAIFLPAMAVSFATGPVAGQNFGARKMERVRESFRKGALISVVIMAAITLLIHWRPELLVAGFTKDANVRAVGAEYLVIVSWNFVAQGLIFTCSGLFQGLGDTRPALWSSATRLLTFVPPAIWLSSLPDFKLQHVWYLSLSTVLLQAAISYLLVRAQFKRRLVERQTAPVAA